MAQKKDLKLIKEELVEKLNKEFNRDYGKYNEYDVAACYVDWDKEAVERIRTILDKTNSKIVISSDWRDKIMTDKMKDFLFLWGLEKYLIGETEMQYNYFMPEKEQLDMSKATEILKKKTDRFIPSRAIEIQDYLLKHNEITNFVAIDDINLTYFFEKNAVVTNNLINDEQMEKSIEILNSKN